MDVHLVMYPVMCTELNDVCSLHLFTEYGTFGAELCCCCCFILNASQFCSHRPNFVGLKSSSLPNILALGLIQPRVSHNNSHLYVLLKNAVIGYSYRL